MLFTGSMDTDTDLDKDSDMDAGNGICEKIRTWTQQEQEKCI